MSDATNRLSEKMRKAFPQFYSEEREITADEWRCIVNEVLDEVSAL